MQNTDGRPIDVGLRQGPGRLRRNLSSRHPTGLPGWQRRPRSTGPGSYLYLPSGSKGVAPTFSRDVPISQVDKRPSLPAWEALIQPVLPAIKVCHR